MDVKITGIDELVKKLGEVKTAEFLRKPMQAALSVLEEDAKTYPPASGKKQPFKTAKQRRWFFAALKRGEITVPYRRTRTLGRAWNRKISVSGGRVVGVLGNPVAYAPYVMENAKQSRYHSGTWKTDRIIMIDNEKKVVSIFNRFISQEIA